MSMYELATRMGMAHTRANYDQIERRITQMATAHLVNNELDEEQNVVGKKTIGVCSRLPILLWLK